MRKYAQVLSLEKPSLEPPDSYRTLVGVRYKHTYKCAVGVWRFETRKKPGLGLNLNFNFIELFHVARIRVELGLTPS